MRNRTFRWISSLEQSNSEALKKLDEELTTYYSAEASRTDYNKMLDGAPSLENPDVISSAFVEWFDKSACVDVLEIGCGNGRLRGHLQHAKKNFNYTGIELSEETTQSNRKRWPNNRWECGSAYDPPFPRASFDLCFSFYVIEHLVYPVKALEAMMSVVKPGGFILLTFPDFVSNNILPSQHLGIKSGPSALNKLKSLHVLDAVVSLYDSRIRLRKALKKIQESPGRFVVNTNPACLHLPAGTDWAADMDAVYIASKKEIESWAVENKLQVFYPAGTSGFFSLHSLMVLQKSK